MCSIPLLSLAGHVLGTSDGSTFFDVIPLVDHEVSRCVEH